MYRGKRFLGGWKMIPVHRISKRAGALSRYKYPGICHGTRDLSKNHDKQLTFIDRVICRVNVKTVSVPESCLDITLSRYKAG